MPTWDYEQLQRCCSRATAVGSIIETQRAYYSARKALPPHQDTDERGVYYAGKLQQVAFAVDIQNVKVVSRKCIARKPPQALAGHVILYECGKKPDAAEVFMRTGQHHASCGVLEDDVYCEIVAALTFIPP